MAHAPEANKITFYARLGDSEVMNELGTVDVDVHWSRPVQESDNPAPGAKTMTSVNLAKGLADLLDLIDKGDN